MTDYFRSLPLRLCVLTALPALLPAALVAGELEHDHDHGHAHDEPVEQVVRQEADDAARHHSDHDAKNVIDNEIPHGNTHAGDESEGNPILWLNTSALPFSSYLVPEVFIQSVYGDSTADPADLAVGDHDPQSQATLQSLHFAFSLEVDDLLSGFINYEATTNADGHFDGLLEEGFLHLHALDWLSIGGGQFLNSFGFQNERHVHAWDFINQNLTNGRLLNEGELATQGGEVIFQLPTPWQSSLTVGGGGAVSHAHSEDHGHDDEGDDHSEALFDPDGANFDAWLVSVDYQAHYGDDENMTGTASAVVGENGFGDLTTVYGIGHEIVWNRSEPLYSDDKTEIIGRYRGGTFHQGSLRWRTEAMFRQIDAFAAGHSVDHDEEEDEHEDAANRAASLDEFGIYTLVQYGLSERATIGLRGEWVSGIDELGLDERFRVSPNVGVYLNSRRSVRLSLQYDYDHSDDFGDDHSIWLQVSIAWGAGSGHGHHIH